ncbi:MAG TPA: hypothetical protein VNN12_04185 [Dehalococcoidia bacterium]|nr:hypothetical protein [Dehalococcoidia bacterium]
MELNHRLQVLEGEMKIVKGEIKEILAEIRAAILNRDNPFAREGAFAPVEKAPSQTNAAPAAPEPPPAPPEPVAPPPDTTHEPPRAATETPPAPRLRVVPEPEPEPAPREPSWSLLTISHLAIWVEDAVHRLGPRRVRTMLELCEIGGMVGPETKAALLRIIEPDAPEPSRTPTVNEWLLALRELEALLHDEHTDLALARAHRGTRRRR